MTTTARKPSEFNAHFQQLPQITYRGIVKFVYDGDTMDILVDLGLNIYHYLTIRLRGVDTPEMKGVEPAEKKRAEKAKDFVIAAVLNKPVLITTYKDRSTFGRYVADVFYRLNDEDTEVVSLADVLTKNGLLKTP
jgi:micrococcal nuclease